ncbi:hypothetical protein BJX63DRAFT_384899 [Aspergillus granulosus]|uniref:HMG box domain-containing protein n=1 Tax=Aspergillus granulosus TaxID=176169 RepID=A0ABR4HQM5_9EURO
MPLNLVRRGGGVFRSTLARPVRIVVPQSHIKRISFVARRALPTAGTAGFPRSSLLVGDLVRSYATQGRPKDSTNKATKAKKPKKAKKPVKQKRVLTEEQQARRDARKKAEERRRLLKDLKETALEPPKKLPAVARAIAISKYFPEAQKTTSTVSEAFKKASELAQSISASEKQQYEDLAKANKASNEAAYEAWVKTHTPREILQANAARRRLAQIKGKRLVLIKDDRLVKRPRSSFIYFFEERKDAEGTFGKSATDLTKYIAEEWKSLSTADKAKYNQLAKDDLERYAREHTETYGFPPPHQAETKRDRTQ